MPRDFVIPGESLVLTKFGAQIGSQFSNRPGATSNLSELGLASESVTITPRFYHTDVMADDFGPNVAPEVLAQLADATIQMRLCHVDLSILDFCVSESMGGTLPGAAPGLFAFAGVLPPAGTPLGGYIPYLLSGYHHVSLSILSPQLGFPFHFPAAHLVDTMTFPMGTKYSEIDLTWRAIPYVVPLTNPQTNLTIESPGQPGGAEFDNVQPNTGTVNFFGEISSSGAVLYNHIADTA